MADETLHTDHRPDSVHLRRMALIWLAEMIVVEPIIYFLIWPHLPPGDMTGSARGAQFDTLVATMSANGAIAGVLVYFGYAMVVWRHPKGERLADGPPLRSHVRTQAGWIMFVGAVVIGLFTFGTYELIVPNGAGGGEGPSPIWGPDAASTRVLPVQVIGQQWVWTYRYPTFGGFETTQLVIPWHTHIAFHVTSLDVIHDWWAYQLGVKADANPGVDNVAFTYAGQEGNFVVRCDELCGIWHGAMFNKGRVVSKAAFDAWGRSMEKKLAPLTRRLPKFSWTYFPSANGTANGGYYPTQDPFLKMFNYEYGSSGPEGILPGVHVKGLSPSTAATAPSTAATPTGATTPTASTARRPRSTAPTAPVTVPPGSTPTSSKRPKH